MTTEALVLFEFDICVPAQQFRIEYTLVEQGGFPFVPEFLLRLLKVSALMPADIARFFGFTPKELSTALTPFLQQGELQSTADGRITLTEKGLRLFDENGETPIVKSREDHRKLFTFDLLAFSYLGAKPRLENPKRSVALSAGAEVRSESVKLAEVAFQRNLHDIYRRGELCGQAKEQQTPELYKISQVEKEREGWLKIEDSYCLDLESLNVGFKEPAGIAEHEAYINQRSLQLATLIGQSTLNSIMAFADRIGDEQTLELLAAGELDFARLMQRALTSSDSGKSKQARIYGALQLSRNWDQVEALFKKYTDKNAKAGAEQPITLTWLAPAAHGLWGKCSRHGQALSSFVGAATAKTKDKQLVGFNPRVLIPLADANDWSTRKRASADCSEAGDILHGFIESTSLSSLEIISLTDSFAVVTYHLVLPELHPVPIPFGFITEDKTLVRRIESLVEDVMAEYTDSNVPRYLGLLSNGSSGAKKRK